MDFILIIDLLGVVAFSISGVLTAMRKELDLFGILIIAFVTSVGGGTLRDVLIKADVTWLTNMTYVYAIIITSILAIIFRKKISYLRKSLFLFDTIGIGLYTVVGVEKAISAGLPPVICIAFGTMSACFGGVIRDILCNDIPVIFHKEIYATACIAGGFTYFLLDYLQLPQDLVFIISGSVVITVRISAVVFKIQLPKMY
jgi:uncharacterized membrane protein YeiH